MIDFIEVVIVYFNLSKLLESWESSLEIDIFDRFFQTILIQLFNKWRCLSNDMIIVKLPTPKSNSTITSLNYSNHWHNSKKVYLNIIATLVVSNLIYSISFILTF